MIILAPLRVTHRGPVADATVLHRFGISFRLGVLCREKVALDFSKVSEISLNKKLLRPQMVSTTCGSGWLRFVSTTCGSGWLRFVSTTCGSGWLRFVSTTCGSGWVRPAAEHHMHVIRNNALNS